MATSQRASWGIVAARFRQLVSKTRSQAAIIDRFSRKVLTETVSPVTMSTPTQVAGFDLIAGGWVSLIGDNPTGRHQAGDLPGRRGPQRPGREVDRAEQLPALRDRGALAGADLSITIYFLQLEIRSGSFSSIPFGLFIAADHAIFIGVRTNLAFGLMQDLAVDRREVMPWTEHVVFLVMNLALIGLLVTLITGAQWGEKFFVPFQGLAILVGSWPTASGWQVQRQRPRSPRCPQLDPIPGGLTLRRPSGHGGV